MLPIDPWLLRPEVAAAAAAAAAAAHFGVSKRCGGACGLPCLQAVEALVRFAEHWAACVFPPSAPPSPHGLAELQAELASPTGKHQVGALALSSFEEGEEKAGGLQAQLASPTSKHTRRGILNACGFPVG